MAVSDRFVWKKPGQVQVVEEETPVVNKRRQRQGKQDPRSKSTQQSGQTGTYVFKEE